jgi:hypothetical protein
MTATAPARTADVVFKRLPEPERLVRLNAQTPLRVLKAVFDRRDRIPGYVRPIHGLEKKIIEVECLELLRHGAWLRKYELDLASCRLNERRSRLRADAYPVDAVRCRLRSVGFDSQGETPVVYRADECVIDLEQRLAAGADDELLLSGSAPRGAYGVRELFR